MCDKKTETKTELAPLSARGESYDALFTQIMLSNLQEIGGYDVNPTQKTKYRNEGEANLLKDQISELQGKVADARAQQAAGPAAGGGAGFTGRGGVSGGFGAGGGGGGNLRSLEEQLSRKQQALAEMEQVTYTDYQLKKKEDPRVLAAIDRYGEGSDQVAGMRQQIKQEELFKVESTADIEHQFLTNVKKFTSGDMSFTPEQAAQVDTYIAPIRNVVNASVDNLLQISSQTGESVTQSLNDLVDQINQTGFDVEDALRAAEVNYNQSGEVLTTALRRVNESSYERAKFQFNLLSEQADQRAAQQAALLGLPPGSQAEKVSALKIKTDALRMLENEAAVRESEGALNITAAVEEGKQKISLARVSLAESQGNKLQGVGEARAKLAASQGEKRERIEGGRADALLGLEKAKMDEIKNLAYGNLPALMNAGSGALSFGANQNINALNLSNALLNPVASQLGVEQNKQLAEAKTTQTTKGGFLDAFTQLLGAGAGLAGVVMGAGGGGGGGGGAPAPSGGRSSASLLASPTPAPSLSPYNLGNYGASLSTSLF